MVILPSSPHTGWLTEALNLIIDNGTQGPTLTTTDDIMDVPITFQPTVGGVTGFELTNCPWNGPLMVQFEVIPVFQYKS